MGRLEGSILVRSGFDMGAKAGFFNYSTSLLFCSALFCSRPVRQCKEQLL